MEEGERQSLNERERERKRGGIEWERRWKGGGVSWSSEKEKKKEKNENRLVPDFPHSCWHGAKMKSNGARKPDRLLRCLPALPRLIERKLARRQRRGRGHRRFAIVKCSFSGVFVSL